MRDLILCLVIALLPGAAFSAKPQRIVSLNLCADQLLLQLAEPKAIASLTHLAADPELSYLAEEATNYPLNYGSAEEILQLDPDLILAGSFTARPAVAYLEKKGYRVVKLAIPKSMKSMRRQFLKVADLLGEREKAEQQLKEMERRIEQVKAVEDSERLVAAVYYANGFTAGKESIITEVLNSAGFENLSEQSGVDSFGFYPLEKLIEAEPDLLILGSYNKQRHSLAQKLLDHPALKRVWGGDREQRKQVRVIIPDNLWICATPVIAEAVEILAEQREKIVSNR
ncbi:MAG: ABC transporter substrate-binding protein [Gammaproteobacteria bacterium]|nr:MAG: ABC transporter substrate-binding protein [Gammaproteobacteria bacterium]